jgi:hypothetical protein
LEQRKILTHCIETRETLLEYYEQLADPKSLEELSPEQLEILEKQQQIQTDWHNAAQNYLDQARQLLEELPKKDSKLTTHCRNQEERLYKLMKSYDKHYAKLGDLRKQQSQQSAQEDQNTHKTKEEIADLERHIRYLKDLGDNFVMQQALLGQEKELNRLIQQLDCQRQTPLSQCPDTSSHNKGTSPHKGSKSSILGTLSASLKKPQQTPNTSQQKPVDNIQSQSASGSEMPTSHPDQPSWQEQGKQYQLAKRLLRRQLDYVRDQLITLGQLAQHPSDSSLIPEIRQISSADDKEHKIYCIAPRDENERNKITEELGECNEQIADLQRELANLRHT